MWQLLAILEQCGQMSPSAIGLSDIWKKIVMVFIKDDRLIYSHMKQIFMFVYLGADIDIWM